MPPSQQEIAGQKDIVISIGYQIENLRKKMNESREQLKNARKQMNKEMQGIRDSFFPRKQELQQRITEARRGLREIQYTQRGTRRKNVTQEQQEQMSKYRHQISKSQEALKGLQTRQSGMLQEVRSRWQPVMNNLSNTYNAQSKRLTGLQERQKQASLGLQQMQNDVARTKREFPGFALSLMFMGMQLQRIFMGIFKSSSQTFNKVMQSVDETTTGFQKLGNSAAYLKFNVGQALEPVATALAPAIENVAKFVTENQKATRWVTVLGATIGTTFMVGGAAILALNGLLDLFTKITGKAIDLKNINWSGIGRTIQKGIGGISIGYSVVQAADAFKDFKEGDFMDGLLNSLSTAASAVGGIRLLRGARGGGPLLAFGVALDLLEKDKLIQTFIGIAGIIPSIIIGAIESAFTDKSLGDAIRSRYVTALAGAKELDSMLADFKSDIDQRVQQKIAQQQTSEAQRERARETIYQGTTNNNYYMEMKPTDRQMKNLSIVYRRRRS